MRQAARPASSWPNGALLCNRSREGHIRKTIIEADLVDGIVALPCQLFSTTEIRPQQGRGGPQGGKC